MSVERDFPDRPELRGFQIEEGELEGEIILYDPDDPNNGASPRTAYIQADPDAVMTDPDGIETHK